MERSSTVQATTRTLTKLRQIADSDWVDIEKSAKANGVAIACREGCDFCCHEPVKVSLLEAVSIAEYVRGNLSDEQRVEIAARGREYKNRSREAPTSNACPFLDDHRCSIYSQRPLMCRGTHSIDVSVCEARVSGVQAVRPCAQIYAAECEALMDGLSMGVPDRSFADSFELGLLAERIAAGADGEEHVLHALTTKNAPPSVSGEPAGVAEGLPSGMKSFISLRDAGDLGGALAAIRAEAPTVRALQEFGVPVVYASLESQKDWWGRAEDALSRLESLEVDPFAAFNALQFHSTFPLAYAGLPVHHLLERFGNWVTHRVIAPLFPDLVAPFEGHRRPGPPRVGYVSPELANKNGTRWSIGWLESHGPEIETYAINLGYLEDQVTQRFIRAADHYVSLPIEVPRAARAIRALDLDVLIFPEIGQNGRSVQFASMRLARTQATAWGFPTTSGLPNVDYYLAGENMLPLEAENEFTEALFRLPGTGQIMDEPLVPPGIEGLPTLPPDYLLMGQNLVKLHPQWDSLWAEINRRTGKPIVMVQHPSEHITRVTQKRLAAAGVNVAWLPFLSYRQFEELLAGAHLFLDTMFWSGGYTTFQAMKLGVPVVTLPGESMRSRLSVAFMKQAGGDGLVAESLEQYLDFVCDDQRIGRARREIEPKAVFGDNGVGDALRQFIFDRVAEGR